MVDCEAALPHHLLKISVGELVSAIPPDAQEDDRGLEVAPLEGGLNLFTRMIPERCWRN
jgi:hypothetical protein